ncbi:MAG: hypothetical protein HUU21_38580 [Polyangiaceae bacterium]|nr:hypothetical protein [Polyangiaceae bacterium]NUQ79452.1 hypothetical protein [Polyangiaceae bacterium]
MGRLKRQFAVLSAVIAVGCFALVAGAQTPPAGGKDRKEIREDRKEIREDKKELREALKKGDKEEAREAREELREDRKELREDRKEAREDKKDRIEDLRQTRKERRLDRLKKWREKWGDIANRPNVKAEVKVHARRMARLNHMRRLADANGKTELVARIDKLIEREQARHTAALERFKAEGDKK